VIATQEARSKRSFDWRTSKTTREVCNARSRHCITRTQELAKWQETYATKDPETPEHGNEKEETKETVKLLARGEKKQKKPTNSNLGNQKLSNKYNVALAN
jgi:hypothetical protein